MTTTETTETTPDLERSRPAADDLPPAVRHVLEIGAQQLALIRAEEQRAFEAEEQRQNQLWAAAIEPLREAVAAVVPGDLLAYVNLREATARDTHGPSGSGWTNWDAYLRLPGCDAVTLRLHRGYDRNDGNWLPWRLLGLFDPKGTGRTSLPVALAVARESWLARQEHEDRIPF